MKRAKYFLALAIASLTAMSGLLSLVPQQVSAAPYINNTSGPFYDSNNSVITQSQIWSEYNAAITTRCALPVTGPPGPAGTGISAQDILSGNWFVGESKSVAVGHHTEPKDANVNCQNGEGWFTNLLSAAGYSTPDQIATAARRVFTYQANTDSYYLKTDSRAQLKAVLVGDNSNTTSYPGLFHGQPPSESPDYITYTILFQNFIAGNACKAIPTPTAGGLNNEYDKTPISIAVYDEASEKVIAANYSYIHKGDIGIGWGLPIGGDEDGHLNCTSIAQALYQDPDKNADGTLKHPNKYADDLKSYLSLNDQATVGTAPGATATPELACGSLMKNALNWILCPIVQGVDALIAQLDNAINSMLTIDTDKIFKTNTQPGHGYYQAWSAFRGFALGLIVIAALVMVIAQALGMEILDAYTIKKILPRLIIAVIGISLSWAMMEFLVTFTNQVGNGLRQLIYFPFHEINGNQVPLGGGSTVVLSLISMGALGALGILGLASFVATAAVSVLIAFLVLVMRQILIIVLIMLAPIAIACYILPNTQSVWKLWSESLSKGLLMFPIIVAFLASGRVVALTAVAGDNPSTVTQLIAFAAYFLPYFLIPVTFRFAGNLMRLVGGTVNNTNKGPLNRLKKYREDTRGRRAHDWRNGSLYRNRGTGRLVNNAGRRAAVGFSHGKNFGFGKTGRAAMATRTSAANEATLKNNAQLYELRNNDDANAIMGLSGGSKGGAKQAAADLRGQWMQPVQKDYDTARGRFQNSQAAFAAGQIGQDDMDFEQTRFNAAQSSYAAQSNDVNTRTENAVAAAEGVGFSRQNASAALQTMAQNKSRAIAPGRHDIVAEGIKRLAGGNTGEQAGLAFGYQYFSRDSGRGDLGGSWNTPTIKADATKWAAAANQRAVAMGEKPVFDQDTAAQDLVAMDGINRTEVPAMVRGHTNQMKQYSETLRRTLKYGDDGQKKRAATNILEMQKNMSYASEDNRKIINDLLTSKEVGVDYASKDSIEEQLANRVNTLSAEQYVTGSPVSPLIGGTELTRGARTYDRETLDRERMGG